MDSVKIETAGIIRNYFINAKDLKKAIKELKEIHLFSEFGNKIEEIYTYIEANGINFQYISNIFNEHTNKIVSELSNLIEDNSPSIIQTKLYNSNGVQIELINNEAQSGRISKDEILNNLPDNINIDHKLIYLRLKNMKKHL